MYIKSQNLKQLYRIIFLLCCEAGMILQYIDSLRRGNADTLLYYYTVQSGILCFLYFFFLAVFNPKKEKAVIRGAVTMCIAVTAIAYLFMPNGAKEAAASDKAFYTGYILMHYIVPLMVILDYLLFFPKGLYKALHPLCWLILPYLYIAFTMIRWQQPLSVSVSRHRHLRQKQGCAYNCLYYGGVFGSRLSVVCY